MRRNFNCSGNVRFMLPASVWADPQPPGAGWEFDHTGSITMGGSYWGYSGGPFIQLSMENLDVPAYWRSKRTSISPWNDLHGRPL